MRGLHRQVQPQPLLAVPGQDLQPLLQGACHVPIHHVNELQQDIRGGCICIQTLGKQLEMLIVFGYKSRTLIQDIESKVSPLEYKSLSGYTRILSPVGLTCRCTGWLRSVVYQLPFSCVTYMTSLLSSRTTQRCGSCAFKKGRFYLQNLSLCVAKSSLPFVTHLPYQPPLFLLDLACCRLNWT